MNSFDEPQNELERAIAASAEAGEDPDFSAQRGVIIALATNSVVVMLAEPWNGTAAPEQAPRPMLVSDGPDRNQPMLAIFTSAERARDFQARYGGAEHATEVPAPWAILATPEGSGIAVNPNQELSFRVSPQTVTTLRRDVTEAIERARAGAGS